MFSKIAKIVARLSAAATLAATLATGSGGQTRVDQIMTIVNDDIITRSDLLWSLALDPAAPSPAGPLSSDVLRRKLDVMIDAKLIAQEAARLPAPEITQEDLRKKKDQLIGTFKSQATFLQRIESVGLTLERVDDLMRQRILIERFVDFRFRSFVFVSDADVQRYYDDQLVRQMRAAGQVPPALDKVRADIVRIVKEEKVNSEIDTWLESARQHADVVHLAEP